MCMLLVASAHFLTFWICTVINWHTLCVMACGGSCRRHNIFAHACLQFCAHGCTWSNRSSSLQPTEAVLEASRSNELFLITCACKCPQAYVASLDMEHFFLFCCCYVRPYFAWHTACGFDEKSHIGKVKTLILLCDKWHVRTPKPNPLHIWFKPGNLLGGNIF